MMDRVRGKRCLMGLLSVVWVGAGCQVLPDRGVSCPADQVVYHGFNWAPRVRYGAYPASIMGTPWLGRELGSHGYYYSPFEKNGIVYTCRAGHVDIIHLRIAADWTAYLAAQTYQHLMKNDAGFSYKLAVDRSRSYAQFTYPANWKSLPEPQRSQRAKEIALAAGPYLCFTMTTWHEILTWYGFKCIGLPTEFPSAFSWEDSFSNLLGTVVAVKALQDPQHSYNQAVKIALDEEMEKLGIQPASVSKRASEFVKGTWYSGPMTLLVEIRKRNLDVGLGDGLVTPTLIPNVPQCPGATPLSYPAPNLDALAKHGFALTVQIEPHEWEKGKILRVVYGDQKGRRILPEKHFPLIMDHIRQAGTAKYGPEYMADEEAGPPPAETTNRGTAKDRFPEPSN